MASFLRWAGSKRLLLPQLRGMAESLPHERYVEPFAGSAALFFALEPPSALLSDINGELIDAYKAVQRDVELVLECLHRIPKGRTAYYEVREQDVSDAPLAVRAARFLYLNRYCFNGLYRTNMAGRFNVPYGPPKSPVRDFDDRLRAGAVALRMATVLRLDFESVLSRLGPGDFVYLDPPYAVDERRIFREYLPGSFSSLDLPRLKEALVAIDEVGATFVLSYAMSEEGRSLIGDWHHEVVRTRRNVAGFAGHRRSAVEVIISNREFTAHVN